MAIRHYIKHAWIIAGITLLLSCLFCSTNTKASSTSGLFDTYLMQEVQEETTPPAQVQEEPPVVTLNAAVTSSSIISATVNDITIAWDSVPDAEGYELNISYNDISYTIETTDTIFTIPSLSTATVCSYQIRYFKTILGIKTYSEASATFLAATTVNQVTGVSITAKSAAQTASSAAISLSWEAMNNASYMIYYKTSTESAFTLSGETASNNYTIEGLDASAMYDMYVQAYCLDYANTGMASDIITTYTCPASVAGFRITKEKSHKIGLEWDENPTGSSYYIYRSINDMPYELYMVTTGTALSDKGLDAGTVYSYVISSYNDASDLISPFSDELRAVTTPYATTGLALSKNTASSIHLAWDYNATATGYIIYRRKGSGNFKYLDSTTELFYTDTGLSSGKNYHYKIKTYADTEEHTSKFGDVQKTSTLPAQVTISSKAGYGRLRLQWKSVSGASGYYVYQEADNGEYNLIDTVKKKDTLLRVYKDLAPEETYKYNITAYRIAFGKEFISENSIVHVTPRTPKGTTTTPSYYKTKKELLSSDAWKNTTIVKNYADYSKSYTIPGIRSTNVAGFESTSMCPQGLAFAKDYMLISSYDTHNEENSVIYVLDKEFKDLLTVIVLPNKTHAGGITFDGKNVWVTNGKEICTIDFKELDEAAQENATFRTVEFTGTYNLGKKASFLSWYKDQIWAGSFEYTTNGTLRSYKLKDTEDGLKLEQKANVTIPPAVQGITFSGNRMILSRAYGYTSELNIYKPSDTGKTSMKTGSIRKTVKMPALNEEIAVSGNYIYVNFESAIPGSQAPNHMDRVLAIKLEAVLKENR